MVAVFLFITVLVNINTVLGLCPDQWTQFRGSCYFLFEDKEEWPQANLVCQLHKAHLVMIESSQENNFLEMFVRSRQVHPDNVWIGANDMMLEGDFRWAATDEAVTFTDWAPGKPSGHNSASTTENCLDLQAHLGFKWNDESCSIKAHFLCETWYL